MPSATFIAVMVMPAYGVTLYLINLNRSWWAERIVVNAAWVYGGFVALGAIAATSLTPRPHRLGFIDLGASGTLAISLGLAVPLAVAAYFIELIVSNAVLRSTVGAPEMPSGRSAGKAVETVSATIGGYATLACVTALSEEYLFRGAMLPSLGVDHSWPVSLIASSAIFGFHHAAFGVPAVIGKLFAGIVWGLLALWAGSLLAPIVSHLFFQYLVFRRMSRVHVG